MIAFTEYIAPSFQNIWGRPSLTDWILEDPAHYEWLPTLVKDYVSSYSQKDGPRSLLHAATRCGIVSLVRKLLLLDKQELFKSDKQGLTIIHVAAAKGQDNVLQLLLTDFCLSHWNHNKQSSAHHAAIYGASTTHLLPNARVTLNTRDKYGMTPLHLAVISSHKETIRLLLCHGADISAQNNLGQTPLHLAVKLRHNQNKVSIGLLVDAGAPLELQDTLRQTPLHVAAREGCKNTVQILLNSCAYIDAEDYRRETPILHALFSKKISVIRLLIERGANVNKSSYRDKGILHYAAMRANATVVEFLAKQSHINVNEFDAQGRTALVYAIRRNNDAMVRVLLENGARAGL
jgi:ankyrin repeat protein